ncbi:MAG: restriction endonuclease subunit S [Candidatus Thiodiazotropha sp.]
MKLKHIADITMGHSFRSRLERVEGGNLPVIQMKDLAEDNRLNTEGLVSLDMDDVKARQYVMENDIIFRSRGQTNTAVLISEALGEAIVAAPLLQIRVHEGVLPAYLTWFINLSSTQARLASQAKGTAVRMISKKALGEFEITVPTLERQHSIVQLAKLGAEEQRLMAELVIKRKQYMERILMQIASESQSA